MVSEKSPDFACGQILFGLKTSNLNYIVKETPYSMYVTIRKRFIRHDIERQQVDNGHTEKDSELFSLKQKVKDLETNLALAKVECDERELKHNSLIEENDKLEDSIEEIYKEKRIVVEEMEIISEENASLKRDIIEITKAKDDITKKFDNYKKGENKKFDEKCDMVVILEYTVDNKNQQIDILKKEVEKVNRDLEFKENVSCEYPCSICDYKCSNISTLEEHIEGNHVPKPDVIIYKSDSEESVDKHKRTVHAPICDSPLLLEHLFDCKICNFTCTTEDKLKNHMCRVTVINPTFCDLYTKNWIVLNRCTPIFHRIEKIEVAILHCKDCKDNINRCSENFPLWLPAQEDKTNGVWHLELEKFLKDGRIDWQALKCIRRTEREE